MSSVNEKLDFVRHDVSMSPHITADPEACARCSRHDCLFFCPASCFELQPDGVVFHYEGCLECGTCRVMCPEHALRWDYPLGGYGVTFRRG